MSWKPGPIAIVLVVYTCAGMVAAPRDASAQGRGRGSGAEEQTPTAPPAGVTPGEIQRLFDAYAIMQAQQELRLTDTQYPQFVARMKVLQDVRRRSQNDRGRILQQLRRLTQPAEPRTDDDQLKAQLKALDDLDRRTASDVKGAIDSLDEILDLRQQARFRVFEEQMERRKVDLLMRARQANRQKGQP